MCIYKMTKYRRSLFDMETINSLHEELPYPRIIYKMYMEIN